MGIQLVRGRIFGETENRLHVPPVIVINESFAKRFFPNENPIGKRLTYGLSHTTTARDADSVRVRGEIVGIVSDVKEESPSEKPHPATYVPYRTLPLAASFVIRTSAPLTTVASAIRATLRAIDPKVALYELGMMDDALAQTVTQPRLYATLVAAFAFLALLLATLGVYGVIAYAVSRRTREFGIRIALGASGAEVGRVVLRRGIALAVIGLGCGVLLSFLMVRAVQSLLFDTAPFDPATFGGVTVVLFVAAVAASWLPARRAAHVDPVIAMRAE
jgi:putative ABC transport system permease protein